MSGNTQNWNEDAPGGLADTAQAVAAGIAASAARWERRSEEARQFLTEHGAAVLDGHTPQVVVRPVDKTPMSGDVYTPTAD